jgi:microsomal dipeptidase-like Zn-dependent dipeptidase
MLSDDFIVDLHAHPNLKSFNSGYPKPTKNMWELIEHNTRRNKFAENIDKLSSKVLKQSQTNLYSLVEGNNRVVNISLYPTEKGFLRIRNVPKWLVGKFKVEVLQEVITGYAIEKLRYQRDNDDYFDDLEKEYKYVASHVGKSPCKKFEFVIANNLQELETALSKQNTIVGILSIEGAHVFLDFDEDLEKNYSEDQLKALISKRVKIVKQWKYPPLTINLSHHFWNHLSGHATSFKPPINSVVNQNKGKDKGITALGWHMIRELLSTTNGKRILIDAKHMSVEARKQYYTFLENYNSINGDHKIPIVYSHSAVNGFKTMDQSIAKPDKPMKTRFQRFYKWSINNSDEEIRAIHKSEGLIGIMMDKGNLGGIRTIRLISSIENSNKLRKEFCKLFLDNIFQIVKAIGEKSGWDVIALGSDFDGSITHIDPYESSAKLPMLENDLVEYLEKYDYYKQLWYGYTPKQLMRKVMKDNAIQFYKKFFV